MKIVHLASEFPPSRIFGLGRYVHDLSRAQSRQGHEVHVMTNSLGGRAQESEVHGVRLHRIHFPSPPMPPDGATQVVQFNHCMFERAMEVRDVLASPTTIVAHDWLTILCADLIRRQLGGRLAFVVHDTVVGKTLGQMTNEDKFIALLERWGCGIADIVVAVSAHVRRELLEIYEASPGKVNVVQCGVDPSWFSGVDSRYLRDLRGALLDPSERLITYVGRLDAEKGVDTLIRAFARVSESSRAILAVAGKGAQTESLKELTRQLGIESRVRFLGYVAGAALEALYKSTDVLVCPSLYEPFGIVPLEGMINKVPVIVSDTGGMSEIVEHTVSGLKVPPKDIPALVHAIASVLDNPDLAKRLAAAGYGRANSIYSWDRVAEKIEPLLCPKPALEASGAPALAITRAPKQKLTAGIRVKNGERFAEECLRELTEYVDEIVILDDGSTDRTVDICKSFPKVTNIVRWEKNFFHEGIDRNVVLALAKNTRPDWILLPDIDEVFEQRFKAEVREMMADSTVDLYAFLFFHFWRSRTHFRVDGKWGRETREFPIPRLVRNTASLRYPVHRPLGTAQISGVTGRAIVSDIRVKHYGHLFRDISRAKVELYSSLDPGQDYSFMEDETTLELEEWQEALGVVQELCR